MRRRRIVGALKNKGGGEWKLLDTMGALERGVTSLCRERKGGGWSSAVPLPLDGVELASRAQSGAREEPASSWIASLSTSPRARAPRILHNSHARTVHLRWNVARWNNRPVTIRSKVL